MLWQCGIYEIYYTNVSSPKSCMWGDGYNEILKQIDDRIDFRFFPKKHLCNFPLIESAEKFEKF